MEGTEGIDGKQGILATLHGGSLQTSTVRLNLGTEGLGHNQAGRGKVGSWSTYVIGKGCKG